ncbi:MAG: nitroreductase family protein [bacterium]
MEFRKVVESRTSIRNFKSDKVPVEDIKELVRIASMAPSINNFQPWKFIAITNRDILKNMSEAVSRKIQSLPSSKSRASKNVKSQVEWFSTFFSEAPLVIAVIMEDYESILEKGVGLSHDDINKARNYPDIQSAGACIENMLLGAVDMGYGGCWLSAPMVASEEISEMLKIEKPYRVIAFVAIGKPAGDPRPREKKEVSDLLGFID